MDEFELALLDRRNKELSKAVDGLSSQTVEVIAAIKALPDNSGVERLLQTHISTTERFLKLLQDLTVPKEVKAPDVTVNTNQEQVISAIQEMCHKISKNLIDLRQVMESRPTQWKFTWERDLKGLMKSPILISAT